MVDMATVTLDPDADDYLDQVYARSRVLGERIDATFDALEADPGDARWRRHRLTGNDPEGGVAWAYSVRAGHDEVMVIWRDEGEDQVRVVILGPNTLW